MISTQLLKGVLDACILTIVAREETYGYEIIQELNDQGFDVQEGTVYPILLRLEKKGFLVSQRKKSDIGPVRKYLKITDEGLEEIEGFKAEWSLLKKAVEKNMEVGDEGRFK